MWSHCVVHGPLLRRLVTMLVNAIGTVGWRRHWRALRRQELRWRFVGVAVPGEAGMIPPSVRATTGRGTRSGVIVAAAGATVTSSTMTAAPPWGDSYELNPESVPSPSAPPCAAPNCSGVSVGETDHESVPDGVDISRSSERYG